MAEIPDTLEAHGDAGELLKAHVITVDPPQGTSSQQTDELEELETPADAIVPPESLEQLAAWSTFNGTRKACIDAIARNTVGLGYTLEADDARANADDDLRERMRDAEARLEACAARDVLLESPSLVELLYAVKTDEEEVGWGFMEVSRRRDNGEIDGLFHVGAKRMRRLKHRRGYVLLAPSGDVNDGTYFGNFGAKVEYEDGRPTGKLADGWEGGWKRNEVICFKLYTSESRDYGLPRDAAMAVEYLGDKLANESNATFFDNGGALPTVLFVQGEERKDGATINVTVSPDVVQRIHSVLKSKGSGPTGSGRVAVIPLPAGVKAQKEILGQIDQRDVGFVDFRDDMRQRTLSSFRMSAIFLALGGEGRYGAEVDRAITKEQVFDPEQGRYERRLTELVLRDLGFPELALAFRDLAVEDDAAKRSSAEKGAEVGAITWREYRTAHGWPPLPEAKKADAPITWKRDGLEYMSAEPEPGQVPFGWNDSLMPAAGAPRGAENRVVEGDDQRGLKPGSGGRGSRDDGQASSRVEGQVRRLTGRAARAGSAGARRAVERARALPED